MLILPQNVPPHLEGGGQISYRLSNYPGIESAIPDFIIRSESAKNDFFSKPWLHCIYAFISHTEVLQEGVKKKITGILH